MEPTDRNAAKPRLTRAQWKRRKRLRLARNWAILILVCAAIVALMTKGILWLLPKVNAMLAGPQSFDAASYDGTGYSFDADDERFVLVNTNLPFAEEPSPALADADEASGIQLEAEAAAAYQKMAAAGGRDRGAPGVFGGGCGRGRRCTGADGRLSGRRCPQRGL